MDSFREDFDNRSGEIYAYLDLLKFLENAGSEICSLDSKEKYPISSDVRKTLKGAVYILLYNLIESTMREAICFIHESIYEKNISFDNLKDTLKIEILNRIKNESCAITALVSNLNNNLSCGITIGTFNKKKLFSGNIDNDEINKKSKIYGFSTSTDYIHTKHGEKLSTVKRYRNDLAHGNESFSGIGKNVSYQDLENTSLEVIAYLEQITQNIERYINNSEFLEH
ncbi:TPA: MAE_28990/MAE_18760 family HEPN-like nuclease [Morganella morganii]|uniref:MAE_28990/MAE_18760 family HEPN-like nuclease n=1 Tax=Morganella morganii TaxID=582 RepID=UPI001BDB74C1|nr:MAE_28990/MAE_18760 family HEPN-like nuclease [Morganella morganii]MBT0444363.1 hypothetical protein [Morganella morganii subsp. morganii]